MRKYGTFICFLALWLGCNLLFLDRFPFVHSDETWLSGLTRAMLENGSPAVTEPFFDLKPRYPHAIKSLFHLAQIPFLVLAGYSAFTFRLLSLFAGGGCLILLYRLATRFSGSRVHGFLAAALLGLDIQFVYAAHFARQEILILLVMLACFALLAFPPGKMTAAIAAALLTGLCIGLHPNAFTVAAMCIFLLLAGRAGWRACLTYTALTSLCAALFVGLSLTFDPDFFAHYLAYAREFQVDASLYAKIRETWPYFQRLFHRVSGTYYTPDIRLQLLLFPAILALSTLAAFRSGKASAHTRLSMPLAAIAGIWAGMSVVGRFSQPYVVFFFPFCYLLLVMLLQKLGSRAASGGLFCAVLLVGGLCFAQVRPVVIQHFQYARYLSEISAIVPPGAKTIGNLNANYHFAGNALHDYRNLPYLQKAELSLADYAHRESIEYIILSDELYLLHELRPVWNGIYGNINFLPELEAFLAGCDLKRAFTDNQYGVRVTRFQNTDMDFTVRIYHCPNTHG